MVMSDHHLGWDESALVVLVPEVDPLVGPFRLKYDSSAAMGVPAHITINYPFKPGINPGKGLHHELTELFAQVEALDFKFERHARVPGLLYLPPEPDLPFKELTNLVAERFPESPPYEGAYNEVIPHLTVAQSYDEELLKSVEQELALLLRLYFPINAHASHIWLLTSQAGRWHQVRAYPLKRSVYLT